MVSNCRDLVRTIKQKNSSRFCNSIIGWIYYKIVSVWRKEPSAEEKISNREKFLIGKIRFEVNQLDKIIAKQQTCTAKHLQEVEERVKGYVLEHVAKNTGFLLKPISINSSLKELNFALIDSYASVSNFKSALKSAGTIDMDSGAKKELKHAGSGDSQCSTQASESGQLERQETY